MDLLELLKSKGLINVQHIVLPKTTYLPLELYTDVGHIMGGTYKVQEPSHPILSKARKGILIYSGRGGNRLVVFFPPEEFSDTSDAEIARINNAGYTPRIGKTSALYGDAGGPNDIHQNIWSGLSHYYPFTMNDDHYYTVVNTRHAKKYDYSHMVKLTMVQINDCFMNFGLPHNDGEQIMDRTFGPDAWTVLQGTGEYGVVKINLGGICRLSNKSDFGMQIYGNLLDTLEIQSIFGIIEGYVSYVERQVGADGDRITIAPILALPITSFINTLQLKRDDVTTLWNVLLSGDNQVMKRISSTEFRLRPTLHRPGFVLKEFHKMFAPYKWDRIVLPPQRVGIFHDYCNGPGSGLGFGDLTDMVYNELRELEITPTRDQQTVNEFIFRDGLIRLYNRDEEVIPEDGEIDVNPELELEMLEEQIATDDELDPGTIEMMEDRIAALRTEARRFHQHLPPLPPPEEVYSYQNAINTPWTNYDNPPVDGTLGSWTTTASNAPIYQVNPEENPAVAEVLRQRGLEEELRNVIRRGERNGLTSMEGVTQPNIVTRPVIGRSERLVPPIRRRNRGI